MSQPPGPPPQPYGPPPYGQPPYGQHPYYVPPPAARPTNTLAVVAIVCAFVFAPAGLVCGFLARRQIRQTGESGDGLALAAIIISALQILLAIAVIGVVVVAGLLAVGTAVSHLPTPGPSDFPSSFPSDFPSPFPTS